MKHFKIYCLIIALLSIPVAVLANSDHKITICHIPPGNPENAHEITIDEHALPAHLAHGDYLGQCVVITPPPPPPSPPTVPPTPPGTTTPPTVPPTPPSTPPSPPSSPPTTPLSPPTPPTSSGGSSGSSHGGGGCVPVINNVITECYKESHPATIPLPLPKPVIHKNSKG